MIVGDKVIVKPNVRYDRDMGGEVGTITAIKQMFSLSLGKTIDYYYIQWESNRMQDWCKVVSCPEFWFDKVE